MGRAKLRFLQGALVAVAGWAIAGAGSALAADRLVGLTGANELVRFSSDAPWNASVVPITGVVGGDRLVAIDTVGARLLGIDSYHRRRYELDPATGKVKATVSLGVQSLASRDAAGWEIAPYVGIAGYPALGHATRGSTLFLTNLDDNNSSGAFTLQYAAGDVAQAATPNISSLAHTPEDGAALTKSELLGIDATRRTLVRFSQDSGHELELHTVAPLTWLGGGFEPGEIGGLETVVGVTRNPLGITRTTATTYLTTQEGWPAGLWTVNRANAQLQPVGPIATARSESAALLGAGLVRVVGLARYPDPPR